MSRTPSGRGSVTGPDAARPGIGGGRPRLLLLACAAVLVEAALLVAAAVVGVVALVSGGDAGPVVFLVALALGAATLLVSAARGLWHGRRWGRAPVLTAQAFLVVTAAAWWSVDGGATALALGLVALVVVVAVLSPRVVAVTSRGRDAGA